MQFGRYFVLDEVGAGVTGTVYAAYDPQLDRRVALKLLHSLGRDAGQRAQLLREAQAMARLAHPNVIGVHDVGEQEGRVFIAMEFVQGETLAQWMRKERPWRETLRAFVSAGRGLSAAHAAGLVHRDFKPDNVLIGSDGRVRLTDFGFARAEAVAGPDQKGILRSDARLLGSPAYMAPEAMRGEKVGARADQFGFSAALYEALYGERPFAGDDPAALLEAIEQVRVREEPAGTRVPRWIRRELLRGLSARPEARHPSLEALLDLLERDPAARWRRLGAAAALLLLIVGIASIYRAQVNREAQSCRGAEARVLLVWNGERKERARASFAATHLAYAGLAWSNAENLLDRFADEWSRARTEACEATNILHQQPPDLMDLRMSCLDDRLRGLDAAASLFAAADGEVVSKAARIAEALPPLRLCADARALREPTAPRPEQIAQVNALRDELAQINVLLAAGKYNDAAPRARVLVDKARKVAHPPLEAAALCILGRAENATADLQGAHKTLLEASAMGMSARVDEVVAESWTMLINVAIQLSLRDEAVQDALLAQAAVARLGNDARAQAQLELQLGLLARFQGELADDQHHVERAVALFETLPPGPEYLNSLDELAFNLMIQAKLPQALEASERLLAMAIKMLGPEHVSVGEKEGLVAGVLARLGRTKEAQAHFDRALGVLVKADGRDSLLVSDLLRERSHNEVHSRQYEPAIADGEEALRIVTAHVGSENVDAANALAVVADALSWKSSAQALAIYDQSRLIFERLGSPVDVSTSRISMAYLLFRDHKYEEARKLVVPALAAQEKLVEPGHPMIAESMRLLGRIELEEHHYPEARRLLTDSLAMMRTALGDDAQDVWTGETRLAEAELRAGDAEAALTRLEHTLAAVTARSTASEYDVNDLRFLLARALWQTKKDPARARSLAATVHDTYNAQGDGASPECKEVDRWLQETGKTPAPNRGR